MFTSWVVTGRSSVCEWLCVVLSLMSCAMCPSKEMAIVCTPLQMPSMGILRLYAYLVMSNSAWSRTALMVPSLG